LLESDRFRFHSQTRVDGDVQFTQVSDGRYYALAMNAFTHLVNVDHRSIESLRNEIVYTTLEVKQNRSLNNVLICNGTDMEQIPNVVVTTVTTVRPCDHATSTALNGSRIDENRTIAVASQL